MSKADSTKEPLLSSLNPQEGKARITQAQLESYLWGAAVLLRGVIDAGDYKQFIFPLLFFKRISDVYDEEYEQALAIRAAMWTTRSSPTSIAFRFPKGRTGATCAASVEMSGRLYRTRCAR